MWFSTTNWNLFSVGPGKVILLLQPGLEDPGKVETSTYEDTYQRIVGSVSVLIYVLIKEVLVPKFCNFILKCFKLVHSLLLLVRSGETKSFRILP